MKITVDTKLTWNDFDLPCQVAGCTGTVRTNLPAIQRGATVTCTNGHTFTLTGDGNVNKVTETLKRFGK